MIGVLGGSHRRRGAFRVGFITCSVVCVGKSLCLRTVAFFLIRSRLGSRSRPSSPGGSCLHPWGQSPHPLGGWVFPSGPWRGLVLSLSKRGAAWPRARRGFVPSFSPGRVGCPPSQPRDSVPSSGAGSRSLHPRSERGLPPLSALSPRGLGRYPAGLAGNLGPGSPASGRPGKSQLDPVGDIAPGSATSPTEIPTGQPHRELPPESRTPRWEGWEKTLDRRLSAVSLSVRATFDPSDVF